MKDVVIEDKKIVFDGFFKIEEATLKYQRFDGSLSESVKRLNLDRGDSVAALILNLDRDRVILTNQFKYPTYDNGDGWITEIVAGMVNKDEDYEHAVRREVLEETGYRVNEVQLISSFYVSPGGSSERIFLYFVQVRDSDHIAKGGGVASEAEDIQLVEIPVSNIHHELQSQTMKDAKTILALMWLINERKPQ